MGQKITYDELRSIIERMGKSEFTVLDINNFIYDHDRIFHDELKQRYAEAKNYSHLSYLSRLLCSYSNEEDSILQKHVKYDGDKEYNPDFRKRSDKEKNDFGNHNIAVFRCKNI